MTLQEIINHIPEYKVIETGEIFTPSTIYCISKLMWKQYSAQGYHFKEVQKMTPLSFNGERIGIGDTVACAISFGGVVCGYDYCFEEERWIVFCYNKNVGGSCHVYESSITSHTPLHPSKAKEVTMKEVEEKFGCKVKIIKE